MIEPLEESYFNWLYAKVCDPREVDPSKRYEKVLGLLHQTQFEWHVIGDDNRAEDGCLLRDEFMASVGISNVEWTQIGCSILEMLVAFSRKIVTIADIPVDKWFWELLTNLNLNGMNDATYVDSNEVSHILDIFIYRRYNHLGHGGLFPLRESDYDQRFIELWYQMSEYLYQNNIA